MLLSELEERGRRFKLALRAGIPVLLLVFLVPYAVFSKEQEITLSLQNKMLLAGMVFITIYFIYFLMELSAKETLIDQTTHGFNQKTFIKKLQESKPKTLALLIIDNLTTINEHYGGEDIDLLLYTIIQKLNKKLRKHGLDKALIGRHHGAEFLIAINEDKDIQKILEAFIKEYRVIDNIEIDYKFSIVVNPEEEFQKTILYLKDIIAAQEKRSKIKTKNHVVRDAKEILTLEENIITSIKGARLFLSFRPMLNVRNDTIDIYEISVKLNSQKMGEILPRVYLPIVNRLGLGREYDFILTKHIIDLLPLIDKNISLTFNLSPFSLRDKRFQEKFFDYLEQSNVNPSRLIIQLYERKTHHDLSGYLDTLKNIRARGVRICIDNFGSSNASMEYMKHFKFDMVQFDRDYVTNLKDITSYAMLESLIKMSKDLHIITVAKWVDKEEQKHKLKALGIDYLQGFGIAKPIDENSLIDKYNR